MARKYELLAILLISYLMAGITPSSHVITNTARQRLGDLYHPGGDRRVQIRNNARQILGYIEKDGTVTNTSRQRVLNIGDLIK